MNLMSYKHHKLANNRLDASSISLWVIYFNPSDFPGRFVVREWLVIDGAIYANPQSFNCDDLENARAFAHGFSPLQLVNIGRFADYDPAIFEVWV